MTQQTLYATGLIAREFMTQDAGTQTVIRYRCPFCPPAKLNSPLLRMLMKTKEYRERALLNHLRVYHPTCEVDLLPELLRERVRKLQPCWQERRGDG